MNLTREEAWGHLCQWTETESLIKHARAVEIVMRHLASYFKKSDDVDHWGITGLLHDADYEKWPEEHPNKIVKWLDEKGHKEVAYAISAHYTKWNVPYHNMLEKALLAADELTGFIMACCYVRPEGITTLKPKSVKKKLKDKCFAAKVEREEIYKGLELINIEIDLLITLICEALTPYADELGIGKKES